MRGSDVARGARYPVDGASRGSDVARGARHPRAPSEPRRAQSEDESAEGDSEDGEGPPGFIESEDEEEL